MKKGVLKIFTKFTGKHLCQSLFFNKVTGLTLLKKETLAQMFSREFCELFKNTLFTKQLWAAASELAKSNQKHQPRHENSSTQGQMTD